MALRSFHLPPRRMRCWTLPALHTFFCCSCESNNNTSKNTIGKEGLGNVFCMMYITLTVYIAEHRVPSSLKRVLVCSGNPNCPFHALPEMRLLAAPASNTHYCFSPVHKHSVLLRGLHGNSWLFYCCIASEGPCQLPCAGYLHKLG